MKNQKSILTLLIVLMSAQVLIGQNAPLSSYPTDIGESEAVKYFDEHNRWYNEFTEHWFMFYDIPEKDIRESILLFEKIGRDIASGKDRWAGSYGNGGITFGNYIHWSQKSGFMLLNVNKCNGGPVRIVIGKVEITPSSVKFTPEKFILSSFGTERYKNKKTPFELIPISWRNVSYLVTKSQLNNFTKYTAGLDQDDSEDFLGGYDFYRDELKKLVGSANQLPILPLKYKSYVKRPFKAQVISIGRTSRRNKVLGKEEKEYEYYLNKVKNYHDLVTEITLDIGKTSGVKEGLVLKSTENPDKYPADIIIVKKVLKDTSIAEFVEDIPKPSCGKPEHEKCRAITPTRFKIGHKFTTTGDW